INVNKEKLSFEGIGGTEQKLYQFEINLYKEINPEASKHSQTAHSIVLVLDKAKHGQQYWLHLQKDRVKITYLKTDFAKCKDNDDNKEEGGGNDPLGGIDFFNLMGSASGGGGELQRQANPNIIIALVGNKIDLIQDFEDDKEDMNYSFK
ncbi:18610_t:CDS:2, partial [Gigaspora margarita]